VLQDRAEGAWAVGPMNTSRLIITEGAGAFRLLNTSLQSKGLVGMGFNPGTSPHPPNLKNRLRGEAAIKPHHASMCLIGQHNYM